MLEFHLSGTEVKLKTVFAEVCVQVLCVRVFKGDFLSFGE